MIHRRVFLQGLGAAMGMTFVAPLSVLGQTGTAEPAIPILMFHKVDDSPRYPEDVSSAQLAALLAALWQRGFYPVNMSDILTNRVDAVVPRGLKPLGITADDANRSVVFSTSTAHHAEQRNARSMVEIFCDSLKPHGHDPRATLFLSAVGDDRYSRDASGYFGNSRPLHEILDGLDATPGIEAGFHTLRHIRMTNMDARQVRAVMEEQIRDFTERGVESRVRRILAYPYGVRPADAGLTALKDMGFLGAVLAFPGVNEASYADLPACRYDGTLKTDPFLLPRVCIGAYTYARKNAPAADAAGTPASPYRAIDPLEDFRKDVEAALPNLYVSAGRSL